MQTHTYTIELLSQPDGRYIVFVPVLGCSTVGDDYDHALQMARECIETHIEGLREVGLSVPDGDRATWRLH